MCCNFAETMENLPAGKAVVTGTPIRQELFAGDAVKAMTFCGFTEVRPTLLVIGGSSGSVRVNEAIRSCLPELTKKYNVIHLCGKGISTKAITEPRIMSSSTTSSRSLLTCSH